MRWLVPLFFFGIAGWLHWELGQPNAVIYTLPALDLVLPDLDGDFIGQQRASAKVFLAIGIALTLTSGLSLLRRSAEAKEPSGE